MKFNSKMIHNNEQKAVHTPGSSVLDGQLPSGPAGVLFSLFSSFCHLNDKLELQN